MLRIFFPILIFCNICLGLDVIASRRALLSGLASAGAVLGKSKLASAGSENELPLALRDFTKLAPLGKVERSAFKTLNVPLKELAVRLEHDLLYGSTEKGGYILSGDFSEDIFRDDCVFIDPNNRVASLSQCRKALEILFDPENSYIRLLEPLRVNENDRTISGKFRVRGFLKFPWKPYITAYESNIVYQVDENGLVSEQRQMWTKSAVKALEESFTPTINTPPPFSRIPKPIDEPEIATVLFETVNGRRPPEYSLEERDEVVRLIKELSQIKEAWRKDVLLGKWRVVYVLEGPDGVGLDRRIPFPEFSFNDSYQIYTPRKVTNIGELLGPALFVEVFGNVKETKETETSLPKGFQADVDGGNLCFDKACIGLPIRGSGFLDILYNNERLRILRSVDGGRATVVQVKISD